MIPAPPSPEEVREFRRSRDLSARQCADLIYRSPRYWLACESGDRQMDMACWHLLQYRARDGLGAAQSAPT